MSEGRTFDTPRILFEDNHLLVALKQPNLLTQGDDTGDQDMLSLLKAYIKQKYDKPGDVYLGLVHRMDRPVGGLLCFARTSKAAARLSRQVQDGTLGREYVLVAQGNAPEGGHLEDHLLKNPDTNMVQVVPSYLRKGKLAVLDYRTIVRRDDLSLMTVQLQTGRAHQIRVQHAHRGHPLWGDMRYGNGVPGRQLALWACSLTLKHPTRDETLTFQSKPPRSGAWEAFYDIIDARFPHAEG